MAAPTFVLAAASVFNTGTLTAKTVSLSCQAGDIIVLWGHGEAGTLIFGNPPTNDGTALTWTSRGNIGTTSSNVDGRCAAWTATVDTTRTIVVSLTPTGGFGLWWGIVGKVWRSSDGVGAATTELATDAATLSITTTQANSAIDIGITDYSASDQSATAGYDTSAGAVAEDQYFRDAVHYTLNNAHYGDVSAIGAKTVGRTGTYSHATVAVEIKGTAGGAPATLPPRSRMVRSRGVVLAGGRFAR